jgi:hypothetical protein
MFAWGHARLGEADIAQQLVAQAREELYAVPDPSNPYPHDDFTRAWLLDAFVFRIDEATGGRTHGGPWPTALSDPLKAIDEDRNYRSLGYAYTVDRLRQLSRILEPIERVDPYRPWKSGAFIPLRPLHDLLAADRADEIDARFDQLLRAVEESDDPIELSAFHWQSLETRGELAGRLGDRLLGLAEAFAARHFSRRWSDHPKVATYFARHRPRPSPEAPAREWEEYHADQADPGRWVENRFYASAATVFEVALTFAEATGRGGWVTRLVDFFVNLYLGPTISPQGRRGLGRSTESVCRVLMRLNLRELAEAVCERLPAERVEADMKGGDHEPMIACLGLAALNFWQGHRDPAVRVLERTWVQLPMMDRPDTQVRAINDYIDATAIAPWPEMVVHLRHLFGGLPRVPNGFTTATHYSRLHLDVADHLVMIVATGKSRRSVDIRSGMDPGEVASRREALRDLRGRLVEWGQPDWGPPPFKSNRARPGHADAS